MKKAVSTDRRALLILGMHRSGTSAVTRVVNMLGAEIGNNLIPPGDDNPTGFWEHAEVVRINEELLTGLGRTWYDMRDMPQGWLDTAAGRLAFERAVQLVRHDFGKSRLCAVKDPRMCLTARLWVNAFRAAEFEVACVFVVRDPREVVDSLHRRNDWPRASLYLMWVQYLLEAVARTEDCPRVMVTYDQVLTDWHVEMKRVAADLHFTWPVKAELAAGDIDGFLDPHHRHHQIPVGSERSARHEGVPALVDKLYKDCLALVGGKGGWDEFGGQRADFRKAAQLYAAHVDRLLTERWEAESRARTAESQLIGQETVTAIVRQEAEKSRAAIEAKLDQVEQGVAGHVRDIQVGNAALAAQVAEQAAVAQSVHQETTRLREEVGTKFNQLQQDMTEGVQRALSQAREELSGQSEELRERVDQHRKVLHEIEARLQRQYALLNTALLRLEQMGGDHAVLNANGNKLDAIDATLGSHDGKLDAIGAMLGSHDSKLGAIDAMLRTELQVLREARERSDLRLAGVKASTSWRLTKPLRWLSVHILRRPHSEM